MLCKIADLLTEVPETGGLAPRCQEYLYPGNHDAEIIIRTDLYRQEQFSIYGTAESFAYMESAYQFYLELVRHNGFYLHSSSVALDEKAYLFSGPCGMGKSTHTRLWQQIFGSSAQVFNDDKPALRCINGEWYAYGTPWCGKDGINQNKKVSLAGICFLQQSSENHIRRLSTQEALTKILTQTIRKFNSSTDLSLMLATVGKLVTEIPVFELKNRPEPEAAWLSYNTMHCAAEEANHEN